MPLNRYGEDTDDPPSNELHHRERCGGWLGADLDGRPVPCLQCKPHLKDLRRNLYG